MQGYMQFAALCVTLFISITSGLFTGWVCSKLPNVEEPFVDTEHWDEVEWDDEHEAKEPATEEAVDKQGALNVAVNQSEEQNLLRVTKNSQVAPTKENTDAS